MVAVISKPTCGMQHALKFFASPFCAQITDEIIQIQYRVKCSDYMCSFMVDRLIAAKCSIEDLSHQRQQS